MAVTAVVASVGAIVALAQPASALTYDYTNPTTTPAGNPCSNSAGPANGAASTLAIYNPQVAGEVLGWVDLRWSTSCTTNWSRVRRSDSPRALGVVAWATRPNYPSANTRGSHGDGTTYYTSSAYSDQLYGSGITVCANGAIAYQGLQGGTLLTPTTSYCF
jgi:hypothetical protein